MGPSCERTLLNLLAILSGLLTALSLPTAFGGWRLLHAGWLAWVGLVPLVFVLRHQEQPGRGFRAGFLCGCAHYGLSLYWIFIALRVYGEVSPWVSALGLALAVAIESTFSGLAAWLAVFLKRRGFPIVLGLPFAWVIQDYLRNFIPFGGFSWSALAYSQHDFLTVLQILDVTGVYGVTFLVVFANAVLAKMSPRWAGIFLALFVFSVGYGFVRLERVRTDQKTRPLLRVAVIQGNIPQDQKWLEEKVEEIVLRYLELTREALAENPDLVVWPEAAYPAVLPPDVKRIGLMEDLPVPLLMGVVTYEGVLPETWPVTGHEVNFRLHNSALMIRPGGALGPRYDKIHLVPMGEYIPFAKPLPFLTRLVPAMSDFTPGTPAAVPPVFGGSGPWSDLRFGVTICYEDLFPEMARRWTRTGADILMNLTNDAWYEDSSAVFQHADFSRYRAIENRRAMVRATNTGVTAVFGPTGETIAEAPIFEEARLAANVPVGGVPSFYASHGDLFAWGCFAAVILVGTTGLRKSSYEGT